MRTTALRPFKRLHLTRPPLDSHKPPTIPRLEVSIPSLEGLNPDARQRYEDALDRFVLFWGEMASSWGVNRTMAQIHALLYAVVDPLDTDQIMERLQISRGNANMNLRALVDWDLARRVHQPGSRKDFYVSEQDVWKICARVIQERNRREVQPVKATLAECRQLLTPPEGSELAPANAGFAERIDALISMIELFQSFTDTLLPFLGARDIELVQQLIELAGAIKQPPGEGLASGGEDGMASGGNGESRG